MQKTTKATVVFLEDSEGKICLARKKKAIHHDGGEITFSLGTWNGYGGKEEESDSTLLGTAVRELEQESGVRAREEDLIPCGRVYFFWRGNISEIADMDVTFYILRSWSGIPCEGDEMGPPIFFEKGKIPYGEMMAADAFLFPKMFAGESPNYQVFFEIIDKDGKPLCKKIG